MPTRRSTARRTRKTPCGAGMSQNPDESAPPSTALLLPERTAGSWTGSAGRRPIPSTGGNTAQDLDTLRRRPQLPPRPDTIDINSSHIVAVYSTDD
jgi:hypothetical protein